MERQEQIRRLAERLNVTEEAAAQALDAAGGDLLDAALLLEREKDADQRVVHTHSTAAAAAPPVPAPQPEPETPRFSAAAIISAVLLGLVSHPILNGVEVQLGGRRVTTVPGGILLAMFLVAFWITSLTVALGLAVGGRFTFYGPQWADPQLNAAWRWLEEQIARLRGQLLEKYPHKGPKPRV